jgi:hypothetical protein
LLGTWIWAAYAMTLRYSTLGFARYLELCGPRHDSQVLDVLGFARYLELCGPRHDSQVLDVGVC